MFIRRFTFALLAVCLATSAFAQTDVTTSRIAGTVKDNNGGGLPGVTVEAKNQETGFDTNTTSGADGSYRLINLPTGKYTLAASLSGFNTVSRPNIELRLGTAPTINFTMQLSSVTETTITELITEVQKCGWSVPAIASRKCWIVGASGSHDPFVISESDLNAVEIIQ